MGANAVTTADNQVMIGGKGTAVVVGDMAASTAAQQGAVQTVTVDERGVLGTRAVATVASVQSVRAAVDHVALVSDLQFAGLEGRVGTIETRMNSMFDLTHTIDKDAQRGIASIAAAAQPHFPSADGKTSYASNVSMYRGETGFAAGIMHRLKSELAVTAGVSYAGGNSVAVRAGVAGEF